MLTEIGLENFKCFGTLTSIPLARISVFIGPNGAGKSTPIQALMLLKQSPGQESLVTGKFVDLGGFQDIAHGRDLEALITFKISSATELQQTLPQLPHGRVTCDYTTVHAREGLRSHHVTLSVDGFLLESSHDNYLGESSVSHEELEIDGVTIRLGWEQSIGRPLRTRGSSAAAGKESKRRDVEEGVRKIVSVPEQMLDAVYFVPSLHRGFEEASYELADREQIDFGQMRSMERSKAVATTLKYRENELEGKLSESYRRVTGIGVRFVLKEPRVTFVESVTPYGSFNIVNEGSGSNQLMFVLGQLLLAPEGSTITVEEPESHLHPKAQYELANVLREVASKEKKQLIITTHSEHILFSLLTAVASGDLDVADLAINYFEKRDGVAVIRRLEVDDKGRVKGGLPGFFEAELDHMNRYIGALSE